LKSRFEVTHEQAKKINERLSKDVNTLASFKKACDDDLKSKIEEAHKKNEVISKKLITVYGKFEEYLSQVNGGRGIYKAEHETLNEKYQD
jgi:hypothetical protein